MPGATRPMGGSGLARLWDRYLSAAMASRACCHIMVSVLSKASFCISAWRGKAWLGWSTAAASAWHQSASLQSGQSPQVSTSTHSSPLLCSGPSGRKGCSPKACPTLPLCPDA